MTDDQRPDTLRFMPNVRALGGAVYRRSYVVQPLCCPARMSFITGQNPGTHGVTTNRPDLSPGLERIHELEADALPTWLQDAGYATGFTGRYLNRYPWSEPPYAPAGWDEWSARAFAGGEFRAFDAEHFDGSVTTVPGGHDTEVHARFAVDFIRRHSGKRPFFLSVLPLAPHTGWRGERPPWPHRPVPMDEHRGAMAHLKAPGRAGRTERMDDKVARLRWLPRVPHSRANVHWRRKIEALIGVDEMVGTLRAELEAAGQWERTVFVFTSDNGFQLGEHRLWGKDLPYEETARVPLVVAGPGFVAGRDDRIVANVDLPITIARLAGAEPTLPQDGRPLWGASRKQLVISGSHQGKRRWRAIVGLRYALVNWIGSGRELYDLRRDPGQLNAIPGRRPFKRKLSQAIRDAA